MNDRELINAHLATKGATLCEPGCAAGLSAMERALGMTAPPPIPGSFREMQARRVELAKAAKGRA